MKSRKNWLKDLIFLNQYANLLKKKKMNFPLLASTDSSYHQLLRPFESATLTIRTSVFLNQLLFKLDEKWQGHIVIGIIYLNNQN